MEQDRTTAIHIASSILVALIKEEAPGTYTVDSAIDALNKLFTTVQDRLDGKSLEKPEC